MNSKVKIFLLWLQGEKFWQNFPFLPDWNSKVITWLKSIPYLYLENIQNDIKYIHKLSGNILIVLTPTDAIYDSKTIFTYSKYLNIVAYNCKISFHTVYFTTMQSFPPSHYRPEYKKTIFFENGRRKEKRIHAIDFYTQVHTANIYRHVTAIGCIMIASLLNITRQLMIVMSAPFHFKDVLFLV